MIADALFSWASTVPPWIATIVLSALPITECRLTIPVAVVSWHLSPPLVYILAMIGNSLPFFPLFFGLRFFMRLVGQRAPWMTLWLEGRIEHAHKKLGKNYERFGVLGLALFVATPFPGTGVWTGTLAAVALGLSWRSATVGVLGGMLLMGAIVLALTMAGIAVV